MSGIRLVAVLAALVLIAPSVAFAQGAGDDQYQDPFPETRAQTPPDDGLSDEPPVGGDGGSAGEGGSGGGGSGGGTTPPGDGDTTPPPVDDGLDEGAADRSQLPNTGAEPIWLAVAGFAFLLVGAGLRLRTIDPDAF